MVVFPRAAGFHTFTTCTSAALTDAWVQLGPNSACDSTAGEVSAGGTRLTLEQCQKACEDNTECNSITYFKNGWCSFFSTSCVALVSFNNAVSYRLSTALGDWQRGEPTGCASKSGVAAGASDTLGAVTCSKQSCDPATKPQTKQCPATLDCGTFNGLCARND